MSYDDVLSYVRQAKPLNLVYSLLASYGRARGEELPGSWFTAALGPLGHREDTIRQTLYRMTRDGAIEARKVGSHKLYRLSAFGRASTDAGTARMLTPPPTAWDGRWLLVTYRFGPDERRLRDLVKGLLDVEGFAALTRGTFIHARDRSEGLLRSLAGHDAAERVSIFRSERIGGEPDRELVRRLWDLTEIRSGYEGFIRAFSPLARRNWKRHDASEAVAIRFAFVMRYLQVAWADPQLPSELLPSRWPAQRAQEIAATLYRNLNARLLEYGDHVMQSIRFTARATRASA